MNDGDLTTALTKIFRDVFDDDEIELSRSVTAGDIDGWDSLSHIRLILCVEQEFQIRFSASQVSGLANVGELMNLIATKTAAVIPSSGQYSGAR